jgi:hypothetical protein
VIRPFWVALAVVGGLASSAHAGEVDIQHWHNLFAQGRLVVPGSTSSLQTSPALYYLEVQPRVSLLHMKPEKVLFRGAIGWEVAKGLSLWAGVGAIPKFLAPNWTANEVRLWQQIMYVDRVGPVQLVYRGRLEERAFEASAEPSVRVRAMVRAVWDLPETNHEWALVGFDEAFVGVAGQASRLGFDQNRLFAGVMHRFAPWLGVEGGYMWVQDGDPAAASSRTLHTALIQTSVNLI